MRGAVPKQYLPLLGRCMIELTIAPFLKMTWIDGIVVVIDADDQQFARLDVSRAAGVRTVVGGAERSDSVFAALESIAQAQPDPENIFVLVHDAARPCVSIEDVERLRDAASDDDGGLLAQSVTDTLKIAQHERVQSTPDRSLMWRAQTPQMFRLDLLRKALRAASEQGLAVTDDASAMEHAGYHPRLVESRSQNLKVTYPEDLRMAEFWLRERQTRSA